MRRKYRLRIFHLTYQYGVPVKKLSLLTGFLVATLIVQAQSGDDPPPADSVYIEEQETTTGSTAADHGPYYFMDKRMPEAAMDSLRLRHLPDTAIESLKKDAAFWYADSVFKNTKQRQPEQQNPGSQQQPGGKQQSSVPSPPKEDGLSDQPWFQTLLWVIIIAGFAAFVVMYLANSNVKLFRRKTKAIEEEPGEVETEDIFAINYQKEIDKAAASGNYRFAIRLMFLRLLKNLSEKNIIMYKQDKTNFDYLVQLSTTGYYNEFFQLTRNYEYAWYGKFDVSKEAYQVIKKDFENFDPEMRS